MAGGCGGRALAGPGGRSRSSRASGRRWCAGLGHPCRRRAGRGPKLSSPSRNRGEDSWNRSGSRDGRGARPAPSTPALRPCARMAWQCRGRRRHPGHESPATCAPAAGGEMRIAPVAGLARSRRASVGGFDAVVDGVALADEVDQRIGAGARSWSCPSPVSSPAVTNSTALAEIAGWSWTSRRKRQNSEPIGTMRTLQLRCRAEPDGQALQSPRRSPLIDEVVASNLCHLATGGPGR